MTSDRGGWAMNQNAHIAAEWDGRHTRPYICVRAGSVRP